MKLIDKNTLVVEIERRMKKFTHCMSKFYYASNYNEWKLVAKEYRSLVSFINTLEVKGAQEESVSEEFEKKFISFVNATHDNNGSYSLHDFAQKLYNIAKEETIEKACDIIRHKYGHYHYLRGDITEELIKEFVKAMKDE